MALSRVSIRIVSLIIDKTGEKVKNRSKTRYTRVKSQNRTTIHDGMGFARRDGRWLEIQHTVVV